MIDRNEHVLDFVDDYLHGILSPEDTAAVESHCESCPICQVAMEEAEKRAVAIQSVPATEASDDLIKQTLDSISTKETRRNRNWNRLWKTVAAVTAASVLVLVGMQTRYASLKPTPYDLRILGQNQWLTDSDATVRVAMLNRDTGRPIPDVPVELSLLSPGGRSIKLVSFQTTTESTVSPRFRVPDVELGEYQLVVKATTDGSVERIDEQVTLKRKWKLMLSTDKPVYQPGQKILLRALALRRPDLKPITGQKATFTIVDPKGNMVFKQDDVSSKFGITSTECLLAREIITGDYEINVRIGDTESTRTVKVEKYVLPKFKVDLTFDKPFYQPAEQATVTVQSDYFFGKPVTDAKVRLQAFTIDVEPTLLMEREISTDENGKATYQFRLPEQLIGREQNSGDAEIKMFATVVDTAGQTQTAAVSRVVTAEPIRISIIPESATLVKGISNTVYVHTRYADGQPARTRLVVEGVDEELQTDQFGLAAYELTPESDVMAVIAKATSIDDPTWTGRMAYTLACGNHGNDYLLRTDKAVYNGGDTMDIAVLGSGVEPVFFDILKEEQSVLSDTINVINGSGHLSVDLPAELFGTLRLVTYRFGPEGLAVRRSRLVHVRQAGELQISTALDAEQYRPGGKAKLQITVTDQDGNPAPGAISLAAVDEAVFSVLTQSAGLAQTFFTLEKELLEPVYTIYNWGLDGPAIQQNASAEADGAPAVDEAVLGLWDRLERALFARTSDVAIGRGALPRDFTGTRGAKKQQFGAVKTESPFTLFEETFQAKLSAIKAIQRQGMERVVFGWWSLVGALVATCLVTFAVYRPILFASITGTGVAILLGLTVLMIASPKARNAFILSADHAMERAGWDLAESAAAGEMMPMTNSVDVVGAAVDVPRLREYFPETLLWLPEIVTNDQGVATLDVELADSITTWRVSTSAVSVDGKLGSGEDAIRVFQPFFVDMNLPVHLTRNDEISIPIVVYNYSDEVQKVELQIESSDWYEQLDSDAGLTISLEVQPGAVRSMDFPIRVTKVGRFDLQVKATSDSYADAIKRQIEVVPNGRAIEEVVTGNLSDAVNLTLNVPEGIVPGSTMTLVKLHPSAFSQLVEGLDSIFRMPNGCFEQTSSTTYPSVLALDYMRRNKLINPSLEAKARQYIHVGYQRLLSFEIDGGGFDWYGNPPGKPALTAYGLMQFEDMAQVHNVDPAVLQRTREWLLRQRANDGSWPLKGRIFSAVNRGTDGPLLHTAYIAQAVFANGKSANAANKTLDYLLQHDAASIDDPYILSHVILAIAAITQERDAELRHDLIDEYVAKLVSLKQDSDTEQLSWWSLSNGGQTMLYGSGEAGNVEVTANCVLALTATKKEALATRRALNWLVSKKSAHGAWGSTQATILTLKALLAGSNAAVGNEQPRQIEIAIDGDLIDPVNIPSDQASVMKQFNFSDRITEGDHQLAITETTETATNYQVVFRYYVEDEVPVEEPEEPLTILIDYDRTELNVDQTVAATVTATNNMEKAAPMVMLDLPIPGGFAAVSEDFDKLVQQGQIAKYEITPRQVLVYLLGLQPSESIDLQYQLKATMPVKVSVPPAAVYEYYNPKTRGQSDLVELVVTRA